MTQASRLAPRPWESSFLLLSELADHLQREADLHFDTRRNLDVVDIGCGDRPYEPILRPYAGAYTGVDTAESPTVDVVASVESLPFPDSSFDCVLCTQVLEHVEDPWAAAREIFRVLRPGGVAFVSTHGVARYHAAPESSVDDYWRWTHAGLERLLRMTGDWTEIQVIPNGGTGACLAYLVGREIEIVFSKLRLSLAAVPVNLTLNILGGLADGLFRRLYPARPPDLAPNYLVVAVR
jgi:SAM-dependent methyltransferase